MLTLSGPKVSRRMVCEYVEYSAALYWEQNSEKIKHQTKCLGDGRNICYFSCTLDLSLVALFEAKQRNGGLQRADRCRCIINCAITIKYVCFATI